jgi:hypothetical protein
MNKYFWTNLIDVAVIVMSFTVIALILAMGLVGMASADEYTDRMDEMISLQQQQINNEYWNERKEEIRESDDRIKSAYGRPIVQMPSYQQRSVPVTVYPAQFYMRPIQ